MSFLPLLRCCKIVQHNPSKDLFNVPAFESIPPLRILTLGFLGLCESQSFDLVDNGKIFLKGRQWQQARGCHRCSCAHKASVYWIHKL